jgi:hypothetical protein
MNTHRPTTEGGPPPAELTRLTDLYREHRRLEAALEAEGFFAQAERHREHAAALLRQARRLVAESDVRS